VNGTIVFKGQSSAAVPDIAVTGPLARAAEDLALALDVAAGPDTLNARGWKLDLPRPTKTKLSQFRVAIFPNHELAPVSTEVADRVQSIGDKLASLGATVSDTARPDIDLDKAYRTYSRLLNGVMSSGTPQDVFESLVERADALDATADSWDDLSQRASVQYHREWAQANHARAELRFQWRAFFEDWDILICPQQATTAFPHDPGRMEYRLYDGRTIPVDGKPQQYFQQIFWAGIITGSHMPSTVFPTGPAADGLPLGLQAVSAEYNDYTTIEFARLLADEIGGFVPPPGYE
jgi:amidase